MTRQANALLVILLGYLLAFGLRFGYSPLPENYLIALLLTLLLSSVVLPATGAFRREFEWAMMRKLRRLVAGWAVVVLVLISAAAMLKVTDSFSRIWFGLWVIMTTVGLVVVLLITHAAALRDRRRNQHARNVVLVGAGQAAARVERRLRSDPVTSMNLMACFGSAWAEGEVHPVASLAEYIRTHKIQEVWIAVPWEDKPLLDSALAELRDSVVDINVIPDMHQYRLLNQNITEWGGMPVISLSSTPLTGAESKLKNMLDRLGALLLLLLLSPLLLICAVLIRLESAGPVIFRQKRHGIGGEAIQILKFRTMQHNGASDPGFEQAKPGDDRVTRIGRFLRKSSIDELPQLFNVLKGDMSLVGPRPHPVELNQQYMANIPRYMLRHKVKPGITGWAQVNGFRGQTDTPEKMALRIEHDLWYIQNWSLWLDVKILLLTPLVMMHRNAY